MVVSVAALSRFGSRVCNMGNAPEQSGLRHRLRALHVNIRVHGTHRGGRVARTRLTRHVGGGHAFVSGMRGSKNGLALGALVSVIREKLNNGLGVRMGVWAISPK